jgi:hypothetical protein
MAVDEAVKTWRAVLAVEGVETVDRRYIEPGALTWRELPLTLMGLNVTSVGHEGAEVAGRIDAITRSGGSIVGEGVFDASSFGVEMARLVEDGTVRGVSIDLAPTEVEWEEVLDDDGEWVGDRLIVKAGVILGATVAPMQAFDEALIEVTASGEAFERITVRVPATFEVHGGTVRPDEVLARGDEPEGRADADEAVPQRDRLDAEASVHRDVQAAVEALDRATLKDRITAMREAVDGGLLTVDEARAALGFGPHPSPPTREEPARGGELVAAAVRDALADYQAGRPLGGFTIVRDADGKMVGVRPSEG